MIVVIAPDSFKESLSANEVATAIAKGVLAAIPNAQVHCIPMADGGEGTVQAIAQGAPSQLMQSNTVNALGQAITAQWALINDDTAVIEMASAAGLEQIPPSARNIMQSSTYGVGCLIKETLNYPIKRLIIGLGGSATNDAGLGMIAALGVRFYHQDGTLLNTYNPTIIPFISRIDISELDARLSQLEIILASDVRNPLCGEQGASHIFAPQKGATREQVLLLDSLLKQYADKVTETLQCDYRHHAGAGAAGGLGFGGLSFLKAQFKSGLDVIAEYTQLEQRIQTADLVITGEGCIDEQTLQGKTIAGIAALSKRYNKPLIALGGVLRGNYQALYQQGLSAAFSISSGPMTLADAMRQGEDLLTQTTHDLMRFWQASSD